MRLGRWFAVAAGTALVLTACTGGTHGSSTRPNGAGERASRAHPRLDLVVGTSVSGVTALVPETRSVVFDGAAAPALGDWADLYTATHAGHKTILRGRSLEPGGAAGTARITGDVAIAAVSFDGTRVALTAPSPAGTDRWVPQPRSTTRIVVANPTGAFGTERFRLRGNFQPEAFSYDNSHLFLIKYVPAMDPVAYRVVSLELGTDDQDIYPVVGRGKAWSPKMAGTRLQQLPSPDGHMLYTLYSSQPPRYAKGHDPVQARAHRPVAFVHTLNLADEWAICVGLPKRLWGGNSVDEALALSPDGADLYVVDATRGFIADMDTSKPKVVRSGSIRLGLGATGQVHAAMAPDGRTLLVARAHLIRAVDVRSFRATMVLRVRGSVSGMQWSDDGSRLYVSTPGTVRVLDPRTGRELERIAVPGLQSLEYVGSLSG